MVVVNDDFRMMRDGKRYEGGIARNEAIMRWLKENALNYREIQLDKNRLINAWSLLYELCHMKNQTIYFFYPTVGVPILKNGLLGELARTIFFSVLNKCKKSNKIIFDICDLKYEQSIDLDIHLERRKHIKKCEKILFSQELKFVFASESMCKYAVKKYGISIKNTAVLINGGIKKKNVENIPMLHGDFIKFVYAGTLNRGRQIEKMIDLFPNG